MYVLLGVTPVPRLQAAEDIHCQAQSARRAAAVLARPRNIAAPCDVPPECLGSGGTAGRE